MSVDSQFKNIPVNVLCEKKADRCLKRRKRKMVKRLFWSDVSDFSSIFPEDYRPINIPPEGSQSHSNDSAYSADDEDSDMETINRLQPTSVPTNQLGDTAAENVLHSPLSTLMSSSYSSDSSLSTNIIQPYCPDPNHASPSCQKICNRKPKKHEWSKNKFVSMKKLSKLPHKRSNLVKSSSSCHKRSKRKVKLLPREQVIKSLVLRVSSIKLSSENVQSCQGFDAINVDEMEGGRRRVLNRIVKKRYLQKSSKSKSVLQLR